MNCEGGMNYGPNEGYWRINTQSDNFVECIHPNLCLGSTNPVFNPIGNCLYPSSGKLCEECVVGYIKSLDFASCVSC